jgi:hypothetical protein
MKFDTLTPILGFTCGAEDPESLVRINIIPSGWTDPDKFYVIIEYGERDDYEEFLMTREEILNEFEVNVPKVNLWKLIYDKTNDMDLGATIRRLFT